MQIFESNYGIDVGWYVELGGRQVATLTCPHWVEMFWCAYNIEPLTDDAAERQQMLTQISWWHNPELVFRDRKFNSVAPGAFAGGSPVNAGRILMRALYLVIDDPSMWERVLLFLRNRRKQAER